MFSVFFLAVLSGLCIGSSVGCKPGWLQHGESCYLFSHDLEVWAVANYMCQLVGGYLVEINSAEENHYVTTQTKLAGGEFWIGLSDFEEEGTFRWMHSRAPLDSTSVSFWGPGEPDNQDNNENCGFIATGTSNWGAGRCGYTPGDKYVCEQPLGATEITIG